jgi:thioredoxin 1
MSAEHISDSQFEDLVLKSELPVLVDFFAEWCGPCKMAAPVLDKLADKYKGKVKILKLDVDANEMASNYGVMSIPTIIVFKGGKVLETDGKPMRQVGFPGEAVYEKMIEESLK